MGEREVVRVPAAAVTRVGQLETVVVRTGETWTRRHATRGHVLPDGRLEVLSGLRSANRLTAVVFKPGSAVIARGASYSQLPPTAERLLTTQTRHPRNRRGAVSPVSTAEVELDGPVDGAFQVRLRVERAPVPAEDH